MTGIKTFQLDIDTELTLNGGDPINSLGAATKQYVDSRGSSTNAIINGDFDIWQRGTSLGSGTGGRYVADRWKNESIGTTYVPSQQSFTLGQPDVPNEPEFYHRQVVTSVAGIGNNSTLKQHIENVRTFAGETVTLSFWAKADTAKNITTEFVQNFGTGGSPSADVNALGITTHALTASWQKFTVTTTIPSILGKTLGSNFDNRLSLIFWFDAGSNFDSRTNTLGQQSGTFDIAQVQIERGAISTNFVIENISEIIIKCQRYYEKTYQLNTNTGTATFSGAKTSFDSSVQTPNGSIHLSHDFNTIKRITPTVVIHSPTTPAANRIAMVQGVGAVINFVVTSVGSNAKGIVNVQVNNGLAVTDTTRVWSLHYTADAEL